jgi:thymidylate synthase (FAD)
MKIINPIVVFESVDGVKLCKNIEDYGRTCYKSQGKIGEDTYKTFIRGAINRGHFSILEHEKMTCKVVCDRGVTHEIVRHRIGSYSQESTRYVNYKEGLKVIKPFMLSEVQEPIWRSAIEAAEKHYTDLILCGARPEEARSVLPNALASEIVITYNMREWRHFLYMRGAKGAHPQIREIAVMMLDELKDYVPIIFEDFIVDRDNLIITTERLPAS